ncbi:MAG: preprotein translocase subunit SecE [Burkholderiales bacterium]
MTKSPSNVSVETLSTGVDKVKLMVAAGLLVGAIVAFYLLAHQNAWLRIFALWGLLALSVAVFFTSELGRSFIVYAKDSVAEVRKVVWPGRKEATQMTLYVFAFVCAMAIFLWVTDKTIEWVLYDLILRWRR